MSDQANSECPRCTPADPVATAALEFLVRKLWDDGEITRGAARRVLGLAPRKGDEIDLITRAKR